MAGRILCNSIVKAVKYNTSQPFWQGLMYQVKFDRRRIMTSSVFSAEASKDDACKKEETCTTPHPMAATVMGVEGAEELPCCPPPNLDTFEADEIKFYFNQFIKYDADKDGKLTRWELNELYREKYGRMLNASDLEKMLREMNLRYCDNLITFTHYMSHLQKRYAPPYCLQELILIFDTWDKDSDGRLDWYEFRLAVGHLGYDPDHPDLLCRFQKSDRDFDDMLVFDEFVEAYEGLKSLAKRQMH